MRTPSRARLPAWLAHASMLEDDYRNCCDTTQHGAAGRRRYVSPKAHLGDYEG